MAWAIMNPRGDGKYWPDGKYAGWDEICDQHFRSITPEDEVAELKSRGEQAYNHTAIVGTRFTASQKFIYDKGWLESHEQPPVYQTKKSYRDLTSLIKLNSQLLAVDEQLKALIESLEPDTHQFWPIQILMPGGKEYPVQYYAMVIHQWLDSFLPEQSECVTFGRGKQFRTNPSKKAFSKLHFSSSVIGGAHLWRERTVHNPDYFFSDVLKAEIDAQELSILQHYPVNEV